MHRRRPAPTRRAAKCGGAPADNAGRHRRSRGPAARAPLTVACITCATSAPPHCRALRRACATQLSRTAACHVAECPRGTRQARGHGCGGTGAARGAACGASAARSDGMAAAPVNQARAAAAVHLCGMPVVSPTSLSRRTSRRVACRCITPRAICAPRDAAASRGRQMPRLRTANISRRSIAVISRCNHDLSRAEVSAPEQR